MRPIKQLIFIACILAVAMYQTSCRKESSPTTPLSPSERVATERDLAPSGYDVLFTLCERTKSTQDMEEGGYWSVGVEVVDGEKISETGFYVSSKTSMAGSSSAQWSNSHFIDGGSGLFSGGKVWAYSDLGYSFYASNVTMTDTDGHPRVVVNTIDTDIVCAYLPVSGVAFRENNTLTFNHILSRIDKVSLEEVLGDMTGMTVKATVNTQGTYDIASGTWTSVGGQQTITFTPGSDDDRKWIVPGTYMMELEFTDKLGNERHLKKILAFNPGVASIIEVMVPHSELDFDDYVREDAADMYIAQKKTLTVTGSGSGYDPTSLKWKIIFGSDVVKLNGNTGEQISISGKAEGTAVVAVTDGIELVEIEVEVKKPTLRYNDSEVYVSPCGDESLFSWYYETDSGEEIGRSEFDDSLIDLINPKFVCNNSALIGIDGDDEIDMENFECGVWVKSLNKLKDICDYYGGYDGSPTIRTFTGTSVQEDVAWFSNNNLKGWQTEDMDDPASTFFVNMYLPKVNSVNLDNMGCDNRLRCGGSMPTQSPYFMQIANAGVFGIQANDHRIYGNQYEWPWPTEDEEIDNPYFISLEPYTSGDRVSVKWENLKWLKGVMNFNLYIRNKHDNSVFYITEDISYYVTAYVGVQLRTYYRDNIWWLAATTSDNDRVLGYHTDKISEFIDWNSDTEFSDKVIYAPRMYGITPSHLGGALNLSNVMEQGYTFSKSFTDGGLVRGSDITITVPRGEWEYFNWLYSTRLQLKENSQWYSYGGSGYKNDYIDKYTCIIDMTE